MVAIGQPENYQGAEPTLEIVDIPPVIASAPSQEFVLYTTLRNYYSRIRYALIRGRDVAGTVGTISASLEAFPPNANGVLGAPALHAIGPGDSRAFVWSTEVGDSYSNPSPNFGTIDVMGLPLVFLPGETQITFETGAIAGGDEIWSIEHGQLQVERFPPDSVSEVTGGPLADVFLLPQAF